MSMNMHWGNNFFPWSIDYYANIIILTVGLGMRAFPVGKTVEEEKDRKNSEGVWV